MSQRELSSATTTTTAIPEDEQAVTDARSSKKLKNRLAQQKYRTNLKKRLQELEAVAATVQNNPNQKGGEDASSSVTTIGSGPSNRASIASVSDLSFNDDESNPQMLRPNFFNVMNANLTWDQCNDAHVESVFFDGATTLLSGGGDDSTHADHIDRLSPTSLNQPPILLCGPQPISSNGADAGTTIKRDTQGTIPMDTEAHHIGKSDRNMRHVLDAVSQAGFESFDAAITHYYTEPIKCDPAVNAIQKMSRNRHLPCVLRALRTSTQAWPQWEVNGYKDEIIRSAELILNDELDQSSTQFDTAADPNSRLNAIEEFPHLWALMHGLAVTQSIELSHRRQRIPLKMLMTIQNMLVADVRVV